MIAVGCLVQWYEIDMFEEYLNSLKASAAEYRNRVLIDMCLVTNQDLEKIEQGVDMQGYIVKKYMETCQQAEVDGFSIEYNTTNKLYTIADYRREFNVKYSSRADVLFWGESDMLVPSQAIQTLLSLNQAAPPKWIGFFATCKMWDDSWKALEHPKLTDLPRDPYAWYGTRSYMKYEKMEEINSDVEDLNVVPSFDYKFNGCGLIISSELIRSGVNIPPSVFFTHEDTALMYNMQITFGNKVIPFYIIKNILLVHNREHPSKRRYVADEQGKDINEKRKSNEWYKIASEMSKHNAYSFMKQGRSYNWNDVWQAL